MKKTSNKDRFYKWLEKSNAIEIGTFFNDCGELFSIYRTYIQLSATEKSYYGIKNGFVDYITGDELDWEEGHELSSNNKYAFRDAFYLSPEETKEIGKIVKRVIVIKTKK